MKTTPATGGDMTQSHTPAVEALPVVGWRPAVKCIPEQNFIAGSPKQADIDYWKSIKCDIEYACDRAAAQAQIDALRIENERLRRELAGMGDPWISCLDRVPQGREPVIVISRGWDKPKVLSYEIRMLKDGPWERFIDNDTGRWYWYPERMHWMHLPDYSDLIEAGKDHGHE